MGRCFVPRLNIPILSCTLKVGGMDKTSIDRSVNGCPAEKMIVQKSNIDYKLGPMTELGLTLKSANKGTQPGHDDNSGAGANAGSREEMVYVTTDPLSELVWSPDKGLSLKCADCNLADKKAFLWGMMLSAPQSITIGEKNDGEPLFRGNLNSSQMVDRFTLIGSPSMPMCQTTGPEHKLGWGEEMNDLTKKEEQPVLKMIHEDDHSDKRGKRVCGPTDLQSTETSRTRRKTISSNLEKASIQGLDNAGTADSSSTKLNEEKFYLVRVNPQSGDSAKETGSDPFEGNKDVNIGNSHTAGMDTESSYKISASKQCKLPDTQIRLITSSSNNQEGLASVIQEGMKKIIASSSNVLLEKGDSTSENEFESLKGESASVVVGITSHPADEAQGNQCQNGVFQEDEVALVEASPNNRIPLYKKKDKEKVLSNAEVNARILNDDDDDDSHESVESCNNSTGLNLAGKRPWSFDKHLAIGNKMMKKQTHESPHCTSVQRHGSSFMNWISNMVKGSSKSDLKETTLDLVTRPYHHEHGSDDQHFMLQERKLQPGCTSTGFGTVFKALYSGLNVSDSGMVNIDNQLVEGTKELELANKTCDDSSIPVTCGGENLKICEETVIVTENQVMSGDGEVSSSLPNIPSANISVIQEDHKSSAVDNNSFLSIPCDHGKGVQIVSSSSFQNDLDSPSEEKETNKLGFASPNKSSNSVINRSHPLRSLWITRFYPKVSGLVIDSSQCKRNVDAAVEGPIECIGILSPSQNIVGSDHCKNLQEPFSEDLFDAVNKKVQNPVVSTAECFGSLTIKEHKNQKFESTLNTVQPSEGFMNSEAMASVFAKRLDALRHIMPSEVEGNTSHTTRSCIFCGIRGHKLHECSEITESELDALLKKIDSYDGTGESSCLCIRCFQLNHWAIACPNMSSIKLSHSHASSSLLDFRNFGKVLHSPRSDKITNNEESNPSDNVVCGGTVALTVSDGKKPRVDSEFRAGTNVNKKVNDMMILDRSYSDSKLTKKHLVGNSYSDGNSLKNISRKFELDGKQTKTSSSTENVSNEYQITAFYNFVNRQIPAIPRGTFEAVKKLRFSRTDIFKWKRSPVLLFPLEGYFVRLRLRKWEKELGGTGYYVARINGGLREKSYGSSKVAVSVKIGGFKCLVESRFVSNHDFLEDELLAWWCATLKGGGNLPSEKDLEMKLEERKSFGF